MNPLETQLRTGWHFSWMGEIYQIKHFSSIHLQIEAVHVVTQDTYSVSLFDLLLSGGEDLVAFAPSIQELQTILTMPCVSMPMDEEGLPEKLLERADEIIRIVETVEQQVSMRALQTNKTFRRTATLREIVTTIPLSLSRYYDLRKIYSQHSGNRASIAASLHRSTFNQTRVGVAEHHFLETIILRYYARNRPLRPQTLYRLAQSVMLRTENHWLDPTRQATIPVDLIDMLLNPRLPMEAVLENPEIQNLLVSVTLPSRSWFYNYLRWFEHHPEKGETVIKARYGQARWEQEHLVFDTFVTRASFPLQYVFADHWLLDVFTVDEATRSQINRLWFTALIDAYSRCILGTALLYEVPCIESIQTALCHAIWPKQRQEQADDRWICYGIPQQLSLDNAWAHHSHSLENLARSISHDGYYNSIDLVFRPPYKGRYGALIERFFGNLSAQVKEHLPGALIGSSPTERRLAAETACLLYDDLEGFLYDLVIAYQHTPHRELNGMTPHEKWHSSWNGTAPLVPPYTAATERLFWRRSPESRSITRVGIHAFGLTYMADALRLTPRIRPDGQPVKVNFHYDPNDISVLALFQDGHWLMDVYARELRMPDGSLYSLSLFQRELARKMARQQETPGRDWLQFIDAVDRLSQQRQKEKRQIQRKAMWHIEEESSAIPDINEDNLLDGFLKDS
jgi:transposase InsO family protein